MKQILFTILMGETVLMSKRLTIQADKLSCAVIKTLAKEILTSLNINGKGLLIIVRHCLFKLIRIIIQTKSYREWSSGTSTMSEYKGIRVSAKFIGEGGGV